MSRTTFRNAVLLALIGFTIWSLAAIGFNPAEIYRRFFRERFVWEFIGGMWPLNWDILGNVAYQTLVTIQIAWIGTLIAALFALPLSFVAARTISPGIVLGTLTRFFFNVDRSIDVLIVGLVMVSAVGLGPVAGTLAIAFHTIGAMGKLFAEAIESMDRGPIEALEAVGATRSQVVRWAVIPQVVPHLISFYLYRLELNIRSAVVLGFVGAGGIGYLLWETMKQFQYQSVAMILLVIVVLVMAIDFLSGRLRSAVA